MMIGHVLFWVGIIIGVIALIRYCMWPGVIGQR
jgi:hypothetical protein